MSLVLAAGWGGQGGWQQRGGGRSHDLNQETSKGREGMKAWKQSRGDEHGCRASHRRQKENKMKHSCQKDMRKHGTCK